MTLRQTLFKFCLLLGVPLAFCGAATVSFPKMSRATNQSDITGPVIPTVVPAPVPSPPALSGGTNQSDITGPSTTTTVTTGGSTTTSTTTTTTVSGSITVTTTTTTTATTPQTTGATLEDTTVGGTTAQPTPTQTATTSAQPTQPTPRQTATTAQPTPRQTGTTAQPIPRQTATTSAQPTAGQTTLAGGGRPPQPSPPVQTIPTTTAVRSVDVVFGPRRMFAVVPRVSSRLRGNAAAITLGVFGNLGANAGSISILNAWSWGSWGVMVVRIGSSRIILTLSGVSPGGTQNNPVLPGGMVGGSFTFIGVITGAWFDPPTAEGFRYTMTSDSLFTKILDFPKGLGDRFTVTVGDEVLGEFGPGQEVDFTSFPGGGVKEFAVTGISPLADPEDPIAFPLKLAFNTEKADFMMTPIEDPEAVAWYQENPPEEKPLQISILSPEGRREVQPNATANVLQENAAILSSGLQDEAQGQKLLAAVAAVNKDVQSLGVNFQNLLPQGGGMNMAGLNPTMNSVQRLQKSLPSLLASLDAVDPASPEQAVAMTEIVQEVEGITLLLEAMKPMLNEMSQSVAIAK